MPRRLHPLAFVLGLAGLLPFLGCGLLAVAAPEPRAERMLAALMAYGAIILGFLGAVHWGLAMAEAPPQAPKLRFAGGVLPALVGWLALLVPMLLPADLGLVVLLVGFVATAAAEAQGQRRGLVPAGYMVLRWILSVVVVLVLALVLVVRLLGAHLYLGL